MTANEMLDKLRLKYNTVLKERDTAQKIIEEQECSMGELRGRIMRLEDENSALRHDLNELAVECAANWPTRSATLPCFACKHRDYPKFCVEECGVNGKKIPFEWRGLHEENVLEYEQVEVCPYCASENYYKNWDCETQGYIATCKTCGRKIFLCDACLHSDDNPHKECNWDGDCMGANSKCKRGEIKIGE